jgi:hypothetical protein
MRLKRRAQSSSGQRSAAAFVALVLLFLPASPLLAYFNAPPDDAMPCCHGMDAASCPMHHSRGGSSFKSTPSCCAQYGQASGISGWVSGLLPRPEGAPARLSSSGTWIAPASAEFANYPTYAYLYQRPPPFNSDPA